MRSSDESSTSRGLETTQIGGGFWIGPSGPISVPEWKRDPVVVEVVAVEGDLALGPQGADDLEHLLEHVAALLERQPERLELPPHALLGVAHAGAEDRAAAREHVERRPLQREVERVPGRGDQARGAQLDPLGALRDRREQRDRLVAGLREEAVADPDRVEAELLDPGREVEQVRERVVGRDQRLAVVEVDSELDLRGVVVGRAQRSLPSFVVDGAVTAACSRIRLTPTIRGRREREIDCAPNVGCR